VAVAFHVLVKFFEVHLKVLHVDGLFRVCTSPLCLTHLHHGTILSRFSMQLDTNHPNIHVKCYDFHKQFNEYMKYMDRRLQKRRITGEYFHRDTNLPRNKAAEGDVKAPRAEVTE
jgi:hypothetical protein